jgi:hypothetical protein
VPAGAYRVRVKPVRPAGQAAEEVEVSVEPGGRVERIAEIAPAK